MKKNTNSPSKSNNIVRVGASDYPPITSSACPNITSSTYPNMISLPTIMILLLSTLFFFTSCTQEESSGPCTPNPCANSQIPNKTVCQAIGDTDFTCICESGYELNVETNLCFRPEIGPCYPNPCTEENKNLCTTTGENHDGFACYCNSTHHLVDDICVETVNPCDPNPCQEENKTKCVANSQTEGDFVCECTSGYEDIDGVCEERQLSIGCSLPRYKEIFDNNLTGMNLINKLHTITGLNYNSIGYTSARESLYHNIDLVNGQNRCVYTGKWHSAGSGVNCEHTWPQSMGADGDAKSDMHHLFPTENDVNSSRGNMPFGNVSDGYGDYYGNCDESDPDYYCSKRGIASYVTDVFEPADQHKGNVARAMFYFATRYGNRDGFIDSDMKKDLIEWNKLDLVDEQEIIRNDRIEAIQNNRNPYSDCPEFIDRINLETINFPRYNK